MKKLTFKHSLILLAIIVAVIVGIVLFNKYAPVWVTLTVIGAWVVGVISGWWLRIIAAKYFINK